MFSILAFIGHTEIIVILVVAVLIFGATKIPQLGSAIGQGLLNFKRGMREVQAEDEKAQKEKDDREKAGAESADQQAGTKS